MFNQEFLKQKGFYDQLELTLDITTAQLSAELKKLVGQTVPSPDEDLSRTVILAYQGVITPSFFEITKDGCTIKGNYYPSKEDLDKTLVNAQITTFGYGLKDLDLGKVFGTFLFCSFFFGSFFSFGIIKTAFVLFILMLFVLAVLFFNVTTTGSATKTKQDFENLLHRFVERLNPETSQQQPETQSNQQKTAMAIPVANSSNISDTTNIPNSSSTSVTEVFGDDLISNIGKNVSKDSPQSDKDRIAFTLIAKEPNHSDYQIVLPISKADFIAKFQQIAHPYQPLFWLRNILHQHKYQYMGHINEQAFNIRKLNRRYGMVEAVFEQQEGLQTENVQKENWQKENVQEDSVQDDAIKKESLMVSLIITARLSQTNSTELIKALEDELNAMLIN